MGSLVLTPPRGLPVLPDIAHAAAERSDIIRECPDLRLSATDPCVCGHGKASHEHYRPGWDCGICGSVACSDYRTVDGGAMWRAMRRFGLVR